MKAPLPQRRRRCGDGAALVITLAFVVLLTVVVVSYFSRTMTDRQLSNASFNVAKSDQLARSAAAVILGELKQEIVNGSVVSSGASGTTYVPSSSADLIPRRSAPASIPNLIRVSSNTAFVAPATGVRASTVSSAPASAAASKKGDVTTARWNRHYLVPRVAGANPSDSTPASAFVAPTWIFVTESGPQDNFATGDPSVLGRYAYAIYDQGGLLDANVVGYPVGNLTADGHAALKPAISAADLRQLGLSVGAVHDLVGWRNYATVRPDGQFKKFTINGAAQADSYTSYVLGNAEGFLRVNNATFNGRTDQTFLSRQQLVSYASVAGWGADIAALQYLGTFSRTVNTPTWGPYTPAGSNIDYAGQKDNPASANRDLLNVRVTGGFVRDDGSAATAGEPLLRRRFPLARLSGLSPNGVNPAGKTLLGGQLSAATAATIQRDFGLVWNSTDKRWEYCGPTGTTVQATIAVLGAIGNRQPNFFELLKAGMLSGSLGKDAGANGQYFVNYEEGPASGLQSDDQNGDAQIIRIGANIIDQYDTDGYPTEIRFSNASSYGIENLPYLQKVIGKTAHPDPNTQANSVVGWYMAELWNPHQEGTATGAPTEFRFRGVGLSTVWTPVAGGGESSGTTIDLAQSGYVDFTATSAQLREPTLLSDDNGYRTIAPSAVVSGSNGQNDAWGRAVAGPYAGRVTPVAGYRGGGVSPQNCDLVLEYKDPSGDYRIYQRMRNFTGKQHSSVDRSSFYYHHSDPRTDRFGTSLGEWIYSPGAQQPGKSIRPDATAGWNAFDYHPRPAAGFIYANNSASAIFNNFFLGTLSDNTGTSNPRYTDNDGVLRTAAGSYAAAVPGRPLADGNTPSRPLILNRPFRNVGELGYAFRDQPWKNIDFFTANSADAGLLDIFSVQELTTESGRSAGRVSINTRQPLVLQAILTGAMEAEAASVMMTGSEAKTIAADLVNLTTGSAGPLINKSEVVTKAAALLKGSSSPEDSQVKARREAALRALAEVSDTRTWNLMIDVVAQPGRFPPGVTDLTKFVAEGEKRYWLHVAIDRYTGEVIDHALEQVYE
jgi:Tfp pilus assembly protein PilX